MQITSVSQLYPYAGRVVRYRKSFLTSEWSFGFLDLTPTDFGGPGGFGFSVYHEYFNADGMDAFTQDDIWKGLEVEPVDTTTWLEMPFVYDAFPHIVKNSGNIRFEPTLYGRMSLKDRFLVTGEIWVGTKMMDADVTFVFPMNFPNDLTIGKVAGKWVVTSVSRHCYWTDHAGFDTQPLPGTPAGVQPVEHYLMAYVYQGDQALLDVVEHQWLKHPLDEQDIIVVVLRQFPMLKRASGMYLYATGKTADVLSQAAGIEEQEAVGNMRLFRVDPALYVSESPLHNLAMIIPIPHMNIVPKNIG